MHVSDYSDRLEQRIRVLEDNLSEKQWSVSRRLAYHVQRCNLCSMLMLGLFWLGGVSVVYYFYALDTDSFCQSSCLTFFISVVPDNCENPIARSGLSLAYAVQTGLYFSLGSPLADYHERVGWRFFTYVNAGFGVLFYCVTFAYFVAMGIKRTRKRRVDVLTKLEDLGDRPAAASLLSLDKASVFRSYGFRARVFFMLAWIALGMGYAVLSKKLSYLDALYWTLLVPTLCDAEVDHLTGLDSEAFPPAPTPSPTAIPTYEDDLGPDEAMYKYGTAKQWEIWFVAIYNMGMIVVFLLTLTELAQWVISGNATSHVDDLIRDWDAYKLHLLMEEQQLEATAYARDEEEKEREDQYDSELDTNLPECKWKVAFDSHGRRYFYNSETRESRWSLKSKKKHGFNSTGGRPASLVFDADGTVRIMGDVVITGKLKVEEHKISHGPVGRHNHGQHASLDWQKGDGQGRGRREGSAKGTGREARNAIIGMGTSRDAKVDPGGSRKEGQGWPGLREGEGGASASKVERGSGEKDEGANKGPKGGDREGGREEMKEGSGKKEVDSSNDTGVGASAGASADAGVGESNSEGAKQKEVTKSSDAGDKGTTDSGGGTPSTPRKGAEKESKSNDGSKGKGYEKGEEQGNERGAEAETISGLLSDGDSPAKPHKKDEKERGYDRNHDGRDWDRDRNRSPRNHDRDDRSPHDRYRRDDDRSPRDRHRRDHDRSPRDRHRHDDRDDRDRDYHRRDDDRERDHYRRDEREYDRDRDERERYHERKRERDDYERAPSLDPGRFDSRNSGAGRDGHDGGSWSKVRSDGVSRSKSRSGLSILTSTLWTPRSGRDPPSSPGARRPNQTSSSGGGVRLAKLNGPTVTGNELYSPGGAKMTVATYSPSPNNASQWVQQQEEQQYQQEQQWNQQAAQMDGGSPGGGRRPPAGMPPPSYPRPSEVVGAASPNYPGGPYAPGGIGYGGAPGYGMQEYAGGEMQTTSPGGGQTLMY